MDSDDDDDKLHLSTHTLVALQEFYNEQNATLKEGNNESNPAMPSEDWVYKTLCFKKNVCCGTEISKIQKFTTIQLIFIFLFSCSN